MAGGLSGAEVRATILSRMSRERGCVGQVLVDGDTAVLHRLVYFMHNDTEEVVYRAIAVCSTMCSHGRCDPSCQLPALFHHCACVCCSRRIEDALRLQPGLVHALHAVLNRALVPCRCCCCCC